MESRCDFGEYLGSPKKTQHRGRSRQSAFAERSLWRTAGIGQKQSFTAGSYRPKAALWEKKKQAKPDVFFLLGKHDVLRPMVSTSIGCPRVNTKPREHSFECMLFTQQPGFGFESGDN